jgi:hypothetical protein
MRFRRLGATTMLLAAVLAGCATPPVETDSLPRSVYAEMTAVAPIVDARARFREIFCALVRRDAPVDAADDCRELLWLERDEPPAAAAPLPAVPPSFRAFVIPGAFSDCFDDNALAWQAAIPRLAARGFRVELIRVSGRSGPAHNAAQIAAALASRELAPDERIVLVGYSKGTLDALQFLVDDGPLARHVVAVASVVSPVHGSPGATGARPLWPALAAAVGAHCPSGDGSVLESLQPAVRARWLAEHRLPERVAYFSLAAYPARDRLAQGLWAPWELLAAFDVRNDGQVLARDAFIPGASVLGVANADHWDVAVAFEAISPRLGARASTRTFPREALLEAVLLYVDEALGAGANAAAIAAGAARPTTGATQ